MKGDLISRSELLKWIPFWGGDIESMLEYIANMEIAYDVEKVVIGLIEASYIETVDDMDPFGDMNCLVVNLDTATSIVRNGGKE